MKAQSEDQLSFSLSPEDFEDDVDKIIEEQERIAKEKKNRRFLPERFIVKIEEKHFVLNKEENSQQNNYISNATKETLKKLEFEPLNVAAIRPTALKVLFVVLMFKFKGKDKCYVYKAHEFLEPYPVIKELDKCGWGALLIFEGNNEQLRIQ